jgi:hypothetical protein
MRTLALMRQGSNDLYPEHVASSHTLCFSWRMLRNLGPGLHHTLREPVLVSAQGAVVKNRTVMTVLLSTALLAGCQGQNGEGETGSGFNYRGLSYGMSGAEVRRDRLGAVLRRDVEFRDTTTDVRTITGIEPDTAVAALIRDAGGTPAEGGVAWLLMSPKDDLAANPWSDPELADAVYPDQ